MILSYKCALRVSVNRLMYIRDDVNEASAEMLMLRQNLRVY